MTREKAQIVDKKLTDALVQILHVFFQHARSSLGKQLLRMIFPELVISHSDVEVCVGVA